MDAELRAGQQSVRVGPDGIEGDEPEIEQPRIADHQIEAHGKQHIDQHVVGQAHIIEPGPRHRRHQHQQADEHKNAGKAPSGARAGPRQR